MQSTQLKKHLEECSSIRPGIMDPLRAVLCKYTANVIQTCLQARTQSHGSGPLGESAGSQEPGPLPFTPRIPPLLLEHKK